jgi:GrpB-like predicted nucleotidyltransferase (UPF0157 family)
MPSTSVAYPSTQPRAVLILPYNPSWPAAFVAVRDTLSGLLGPAARAIHHVGSTAVPGLAAKPVLDVLLETPSLRTIDEATPVLVARGYEARGEYGIEGCRYFSRPAAPGLKVHLHIFESGHERIDRHLRFRDYLIAYPEEAARYAELKKELAVRYADDRGAYQAGKAALLDEVQSRAEMWEAA